MIPYLVAFAWFLVTALALEEASVSGRRKLSRPVRWVLLLPLAVFAALYAGRIGTDTVHYGDLFDMAEDFPVEPGFSMLMIGAKSFGLSYLDFTKLLACVQMLLLASVVARLRDPIFFLLFYLSSFFLNFEFNAVRNSLALMIIAALYVRIRKPSFAALMSSAVIHYSSIATLALQRLAMSRRQRLSIAVVTISAVAAAIVWLRPDLLGDQLGDLFFYKGYLEQQYETKAIYPALLLKLAIVWLFYRNGGNRFYFAAYTVLVVLVHLVSPVLSRVCDLILFLALLDFCAFHRLQRHRLLAICLTLILVLSSLLIPWSDCQGGGTDNWCLLDTTT
jgi:hypothetical protein